MTGRTAKNLFLPSDLERMIQLEIYKTVKVKYYVTKRRKEFLMAIKLLPIKLKFGRECKSKDLKLSLLG